VLKGSVLRLRDFRLIFTSVGLSALGDELALIALAIRVHDLYPAHSTKAGLAVAAVLLVGLLPLVVLAPFAGLVVDRVENVRILGWASLGQAVMAGVLAFTTSLAPILILSFLLGTGAALASPALFALTPVAVGEDRLAEGNAWLETSRYAGAILGPIFAGGLAAGVSAKFALLVDAGTFLFIAVAAALLRIRRAPAVAKGASRKGEARKGFAFLSRDKVLRLVVMVVAAFVLFAAVDNVAEVFFAKDVLHSGNAGYGGMASAWMLGMVIGATVIAKRLAAAQLARAIVLGAAVGGAAVAVAAGFPAIALALTMFFVGGIANGVMNVGVRTLIHHRAPEALRGRVFAAYYGTVISTQIGATAIAGALIAGLDSRGTLLLGGLGGAVMGLLGLLWYAAIPSSDRQGLPEQRLGDLDRVEGGALPEVIAGGEQQESVVSIVDGPDPADEDIIDARAVEGSGVVLGSRVVDDPDAR
jgi:MFS family permease